MYVYSELHSAISSIVKEAYSPREYPALGAFEREWSCTRPFDGLRVLVATPIFRNTLLEYRALLAGGADLSVGLAFAYDEKVISLLENAGVPIVTPEDALAAEDSGEFFDLILDCAGRFSACHPRYGFVELTRSGVQFFENAEAPVYVADSGIVKRIETSLGTGDGYVRALAKLGFNELEGKNCVVFGCGKVGSGIVLQLLRIGASVCVVSDLSLGSNAFMDSNGVEQIDRTEVGRVVERLQAADFVVTATGVKNAAATPEFTQALLSGHAVLANMGVEDEYGGAVPSDRVLNHKEALNFILEEPTHLKYIDASLALHAALGERIMQEVLGMVKGPASGDANADASDAASGDARENASKNVPGPMNPPPELEQRILLISMQQGVIGPEIYEMLGGSPEE